MTRGPFIKKFKVDERFYIYDVNSNKFFEVDEPVYVLIDEDGGNGSARSELLKRHPQSDIDTACKNISMMKDKGYFSGRRPEITYFHTNSKEGFMDYIKESVTKKLSGIILNVTERCNMRCKYCAYSDHYVYHREHGDVEMSAETMKQAVDFYFANSPEVENKMISFYGGEPLYNFKLIKECVEYVKETYAQECKYNMTTNVTLMDEEKTAFLIENDFFILISLDGPREIHDRYRVFANGEGTYDVVMKNLDHIHTRYPAFFQNNLTFNMVAAPPFDFDSIDEFLKESVINPQRVRFNSVSPLFTTFYDCFSKKQLKLSRETVKDILLAFNRKMADGIEPNNVERALFDIRYFDVHRRETHQMPSKYPSHGQCMIGDKGLFVETDGTLNFCGQVGRVFNFGNVSSGLDFDEIERVYLELEEFYSTHCYDCWAIRLCRRCIRDVNKDGKLDEETFKNTCQRLEQVLDGTLMDYIRIRNIRPSAFEYLNEIQAEI